jgi:hypothetical protein
MDSRDRRSVVAEHPLAIGSRWAELWCQELREQGRPVDGGWPGTLPEARARVLRSLDLELAGRGMPLLTVEEIAVATRVAYERAKSVWREAARDVAGGRRSGARANGSGDFEDEL